MLREGVDDDGDRVVLSRGDVCLRAADLALLEGARWLNDNVISFWFSTLTERSNGDSSVLLLDGAVAFFLANCEAEDAAVVTAPLQCASRALMLFAINDNPSVTSANGGSHWTLLACRKSGASAATFTHYDSLPRSGNAPVAARVAKTLTSALGWPESCARVTAAPAPPQANGFDCALHVMLTASLNCELHSRDPGREPTREELAAYVTPAAATQLRRDAHALITRLAAEADDAPWDD
jgi:sentrin-specific protease 8